MNCKLLFCFLAGSASVHAAESEGPGAGPAAGESGASAQVLSLGLAAEDVPIHLQQGTGRQGYLLH